MPYYAIYFNPQGALASTVTSDMLFGAVCWALRILALKDDVGEMLRHFDPPQFAFSGLFPCVLGQSPLRFYPKPLSFSLGREDIQAAVSQSLAPNTSAQNGKAQLVSAIEQSKLFNKAEWMSEQVLRNTLAGQLKARGAFASWRKHVGVKAPPGDAVQSLGKALLLQSERAAAKLRATAVLQREAVAQRNQIDRVLGAAGDGLLFYETETSFAPGAGLWCLAYAQDEAVWRNVQAALRYLSDTGLGANRTTGKGHFDIRWEIAPAWLGPATAGADKTSNALMCLSHYLPTTDELDGAGAPLAYQLATVWAKRERQFAHLAQPKVEPVYKRRVRMLAPGSVIPLPKTPKPVYGRLAEVVPAQENSWAVYQSGLMLGLRGVL